MTKNSYLSFNHFLAILLLNGEAVPFDFEILLEGLRLVSQSNFEALIHLMILLDDCYGEEGFLHESQYEKGILR